MKLYFKYILALFKTQLQYKTSFILLTIGQFLVPFSVFAGMYLLFERFNSIAGWSFYEVALCFGIIHLSFSISETVVRGFDSFSSLIITGKFDRLLVRPRSIFLQILGSKFEFTRIGKLAQSIIVLMIGIVNLPNMHTLSHILLILFMIVSGVFIFSGIFILVSTLCFFTIQGLELANILTDGGREMSQYPLIIYKDWVRIVFTYIIPFGVVNYYPLMYLLQKQNFTSTIYALTPVIGILFPIPCYLIFKQGVKKYQSTGS